MALYFYKALSREGKKISGQLDAASLESVRSQLSAKGLFPIEIKSQSQAPSSFAFVKSLFETQVSAKDLIFFTKQLSVLLKSGVPLLQALELLSEQFIGKLHTILVSLKDNVKDGKSLADGLQVYPKTFSNIYIQLIRAGEATGKLETILEKLTEYLERENELQSKVSNAMVYPAIQLGAIVLAVVAIMVFVVPNLESMLKSTGQELPLATKILLAGSELITKYYVQVLITLLLITVAIQYWLSTPRGKKTIDQLVLKLPVLSFFARTNAVVQFCNTLGMLLESGVTLSNALDIVVEIIDNSILVQTLKDARDKIIKQGKITPFLKETNLFPSMAIYLINTGEQSGKLDFMLLTVARNYETELIDLTDKITDNIPTVMIFVMGGVVGLIMLAIMGPILSMYEMSGI